MNDGMIENMVDNPSIAARLDRPPVTALRIAGIAKRASPKTKNLRQGIAGGFGGFA
jgi:hypothetical protein